MLRRKPVLVLVVTAFLTLPLARPSLAAAAPRAGTQGAFWGQLWEWLASSIPGLDAGLGAGWRREGPASDPDGKVRSTRPPLTALWGKEGPAIDPDGKARSTRPPLTALWGEEGPASDPNGRASTAATSPTTGH